MTHAAPIRVCTLDSQPLVHGGVRQLLSLYTDIVLVGEAYDVDDLLRVAEHGAPLLALVEIDDLGPDWAGALRRLRSARPGLRLAVLTASLDAGTVRAALQAGASGYFLKRVQPLTLAQGVRSIAAGQQVLDPEATRALLADEHDPEGAPLLALSQREREVLTLMARGLANKEIADRLCVSLSTVKFHIAGILSKLGVRSRAQAIVHAYEHSLVPRIVVDATYQAPYRLVREQAGAAQRA